ncbi:MAG: hypothetical protein GHCLOJNM_01673 [bacterium]|nr:hypothetical protein [bacterium]
MNPKKTIALAVIAIAIIAFYVMDKEKVAEVKKQEEQSKDFFLPESKAVTKITVDRRGKKVVAQRDGEDWKITEPVSWAGDKYAWNSIADNLANAKIDRTFPDEGETLSEEDKKKWGLTDPGLVIAATVKDGSDEKEVRLEFGNKPPGSTAQIFATNSERSDKVFMIPQTVVSSASKELRDLRNRKLLDIRFDDEKLTRLEVSKKGLDLVAEKKPDKSWKMVQPQEARIDSAQLRKYVDKLGNDASDIVDGATEAKLREVGLADDQIASTTRYKVFTGESSVSFYVGKFSLAEKGVVGRREGSNALFVLAKEFFNDQPSHPDELRPKKAISLDTWNTDVFSATAEGKLLYSMEKKDGKWRMVAPYDATAERDVTESILRAFNDNKIIGYVDGIGTDSELGYDNPRLIFMAKGKDKSDTLVFGNLVDDRSHAAWKGEPDRFLIPNKVVEAIMKKPLDLLTAAERERVAPKKEEPKPAVAGAPSSATGTAAAPVAPATGETPPAQPAPAEVAPATGAVAPATGVVVPATK